MRANNKKHREGAVLGAVLIRLGVATLICTGLVKLLGAEQFESEQRLQSLQAYWTAEAGVQETVFKLANIKKYRESGYMNGVAISRVPDYNANITVSKSSEEYTITSHGVSSKSGIERGVREVIKLKPNEFPDQMKVEVLSWQEI